MTTTAPDAYELLKGVARARGGLVLQVYAGRQTPEPQQLGARLLSRLSNAHDLSDLTVQDHPEDIQGIQILLKDPDQVRPVLDALTQGEPMLYDEFLADKNGQPVSRALQMYRFMERITPMDTLVQLLTEIYPLVPKEFDEKFKAYVSTLGQEAIDSMEIPAADKTQRIAEMNAIINSFEPLS
jgi:hypothetical protein